VYHIHIYAAEYEYILNIFEYPLFVMNLDEIHVASASPDFNHSFVTISMHAVSAVMDERASVKECFTLEKRRSTETLTPGMARISRATRAIYLRVPWFLSLSCFVVASSGVQDRGASESLSVKNSWSPWEVIQDVASSTEKNGS
jgi:hypothetical protein